MIIEAWEKGPRQVSSLARSYFKYIYIYAAIALTLPSSGSYKTYYNLENF
jgi:hypothetical protein